MNTDLRPCIHLVGGARPNFMKIAPVVRALQADGRLRWKLVHTGQHYDRNMSEVFFEELGIPSPEFHFNCGGGTHATQTARIMEAFESHCTAHRPDAVVVFGDVNSTLACAIVAKKAGIPVAHVEAGLRSGDQSMPEEINRMVTDAISDWFFVTEPSGADNLRREGHAADRIYFVGHVMADNVMHQVGLLDQADTLSFPTSDLKQRLVRYGVVTLHRPANVDDPVVLRGIAQALRTLSERLPLVFPVHPRTQGHLSRLAIDLGPNVHMLPPQPYMSFLNLWKDAALVLTDSGGLQEETTVLGVPCVTLRENTERPVTVDQGSNVLAGVSPDRIISFGMEVIETGGRRGHRPPLWDGLASRRIVDVLASRLLPASPA